MKKAKLPSLISVLILTLITVVMWVSLDVYRAVTKSSQEVVPPEIIKPLTPSLDQEAIYMVESRIFLEDSEISEPVIGFPATPAAQPTAVPITSPVIQPTEEPIDQTDSETGI